MSYKIDLVNMLRTIAEHASIHPEGYHGYMLVLDVLLVLEISSCNALEVLYISILRALRESPLRNLGRSIPCESDRTPRLKWLSETSSIGYKNLFEILDYMMGHEH